VRVLIVSSYPPRHCGIGAYAAAQAGRLRSEGQEVVVLSPPDGDGELTERFIGGAAFRRAAAIADGCDRIVVNFEPGLYFRPGTPARTVTAASHVASPPRPAVEIVARGHRRLPGPTRLPAVGPPSRARLRSTREPSEALERAYDPTRSILIPHADSVTVHERLSRDQARSRLGIEIEGAMYVCAGFLHADKGFDRAVRAFGAAGSPGRLFVVGSVRGPSVETRTAGEGARERTDGVTMIERFWSPTWSSTSDLGGRPGRVPAPLGVVVEARAPKAVIPAFVAEVGRPRRAGGDGGRGLRSDERRPTCSLSRRTRRGNVANRPTRRSAL
jgi:hypothetical protein